MSVLTGVTIRPFEDQDYRAAVAISAAVYPDYPWSEEEWRHEDARYDGHRLILQRIVAVLPDGRLVGIAEFKHTASTYHPQKFWIDLDVHPEFQGRGVGTGLYGALMGQLASRHPLLLWTGIRETSQRGIGFVTTRSFREVRRAWELRLDVASFDPTPYEARSKAALGDLQIVTVAEERATDPYWMQKVHDLHIEVGADVPRPGAYTPRTLDDYARNLFEHPDYIAEGHFLIKDRDRYVAETFLMSSQALADVLYQGLTGTRRAYRRRGLALALKLHAIAYARAHGTREIRTWNDSLNQPMLHINTKLGFQRQPAWITFEKRMQANEDE